MNMSFHDGGGGFSHGGGKQGLFFAFSLFRSLWPDSYLSNSLAFSLSLVVLLEAGLSQLYLHLGLGLGLTLASLHLVPQHQHGSIRL